MPWRKYLRVAGLVLGLLLFLREILRVGSSLTRKSFYFPDVWFLLAAILLNASTYFIQILSWNMIMRYLGVSVSLRQSIQGYPLTFLPRYIPGGIWGYWSRSEWLKESYGINYTDSFMASALETTLLALTAILLAVGGGSFFLSGIKRTVAGVIAGSLLILIGCGIPQSMSRIRRGVSQFTSSGYWYGAAALSLILVCLHGGTLYLIGLAIQPDSSLDLIGATYVMSLSWFLGFVFMFIPAGIGIRETALSSLLISRFGFLAGQASLVAITFRFLLILTEVEWLAVALVLRGPTRWGKANMNILSSHKGK